MKTELKLHVYYRKIMTVHKYWYFIHLYFIIIVVTKDKLHAMPLSQATVGCLITKIIVNLNIVPHVFRSPESLR